jgi:hypothetical protein
MWIVGSVAVGKSGLRGWIVRARARIGAGFSREKMSPIPLAPFSRPRCCSRMGWVFARKAPLSSPPSSAHSQAASERPTSPRPVTPPPARGSSPTKRLRGPYSTVTLFARFLG